MTKKAKRLSVRTKPMFCTKCGAEMDMWDRKNKFEIHRNVGYGSRYDLTVIKICLCNRCFDELADSCVSSPVERIFE